MQSSCMHFILFLSLIAMGFESSCIADSTKTAELEVSQLNRLTSYHIGNSLTWDMQPLGLVAIAASRGIELAVGYHIRSASSLERIWREPKEISVKPVESFGLFTEALPHHEWTFVTLQPYRAGTTMESDIECITKLIELARSQGRNANTRFYIYQSWPQSPEFRETWTSNVADSLDTSTIHAREYYHKLIERIRANTDAPIFMVPTTEALYQLDIRLRAGEIEGYKSVADLYRDVHHLTYEAGRYVAAVTTFSTLFAQDPDGLTKPMQYSPDKVLSPQMYSLIHKTVWDVVTTHPYTGVKHP